MTVSYTTKNGRAKAPADYYKRKGMLTLAPGETTKMIVVYIRGGLRAEITWEKFYVHLLNPVGASIADGSAIGDIRYNDCRRCRTGPEPLLQLGFRRDSARSRNTMRIVT